MTLPLTAYIEAAMEVARYGLRLGHKRPKLERIDLSRRGHGRIFCQPWN